MARRPPPKIAYRKPANARASRMIVRGRGARIRRVGMSDHPMRDIYHLALTISWARFLLVFLVLYLLVNLAFAGLYVADLGDISGARPGNFADAFFFSVQTLATIGYGGMTPADLYANILVTLESIVGITLVALATGLMFARFSRPTARVMFSEVAVIGPRDGVPTLMLRMANQRRNQILQANVVLSLLRDEMTEEGEVMRRFHDLKVQRASTPVFALSFTVMHEITPESPLYGETAQSLAAEDAELVISVTGIDETMSQTVHARHSWGANEIRFGHRFVDILGWLEDGSRAIDFTRFHDTETVPHKGKSHVGSGKRQSHRAGERAAPGGAVGTGEHDRAGGDTRSAD